MAHADLVLALVVGLAAVLRFWALGRQGLWYDEGVTAELLRESPAHMLADLRVDESAPPLYYLLAKASTGLCGQSEAGLRAVSACAGVTAVPVVYFAARSLTRSARIGLVAALLVAVNPLFVWYSQEARAYSLAVLTVAVSLALFARARERPTAPRLLFWALAAVAALYTQYFALFVIAPEAVLLLIDRRSKLRYRVAAIGIVGVAGSSLVSLAVAQSHRTYWFTDIPLPVRIGQIPQQFIVGFQPPAAAPATLIAAAVALAAVGLAALSRSRSARRGATIAAAVGGSAVAVPVLLALLGRDYLNTRNVITAVVPLTVVVAAGLAAGRARIVGLVGAATLVAVSLVMVVSVQSDLSAQRGHFREVAATLGAPHERRAILLQGSRNWAESLSFYLPGLKWLTSGGFSVREIDVIRMLPPLHDCSNEAWWGATCGYTSLPAPPGPPAPGFRLVGFRQVAGFATTRYRAARAVRVYQHGMGVALTDRLHIRRGTASRHVLLTAS